MRKYDSKILRNRIVSDPVQLEALAVKFGYSVGDLVKPIPREKWKNAYSGRDAGIRCCWSCNRERPVYNGQGKYLDANEGVVVLDMIDSPNGRLTVIMTSEGKPGYVRSNELEKVQSNPERETK
jgi:hypothetical protein